MSTQNDNFNSLMAAAILGISIITSVCLLRGPIKTKDQFDFKQEGPIFIRFNKAKGDLCYTGIGPNGKFVTDAWICIDGSKTKAGDEVENVFPPKDGSSSKSNSKSDSKSSSKSSKSKSQSEE
ncbi:MAG: hypothetical protein SFU25_03710 [Candidatus Caenarcaniphilales bacterium]|nr:hypothetical protein [Candidatus Caenarcaniphilales bacterium]